MPMVGASRLEIFMPEKATMTLNMTVVEMAALTELSEAKGISKTAVMRQALRLYQSIDRRLAAGETMSFSGDKKRIADFMGLL